MLLYSLSSDRPWFLLLLGLLPLLWWFSYRTLSGLGRYRRLFALLFRSAVLTLIVLALAEAQLVRHSDKLTVMFVLDHSLSVSEQQSGLMREYINQAIAKQRDAVKGDRAGVVVFGRDAAIELPPFDDIQSMPAIESIVDREYSDLAGALKLAQGSFPHDTANRIVVISDGNENIGNAIEQAKGLVDAGIGIDVLPVRTEVRGDVAIEKISLPPDVRKGQPFDLRAVLNNTSPGGSERKGKLQIIRRAGEQETTLAENRITLPPGKRVFTIREKIDQPDFYTYEARFVPDKVGEDSLPQNNQASTFTHVRGSGQVLLIEDYENKGEYDHLVERLKAANLEVTIRTSRPDELFTDLAQLQPFDTVILANVPREHFTDDQIKMLVANTQSMGAGLVMLGGPNSFGAGGWTNTPLEEAMPVDFQIKSAKVAPVGALALLMHASEMPNGNHWQKVIGVEALKALGNQDYAGVLHWGNMTGRDEWLWGAPNGMLKVGNGRKEMLRRLDRMVPGDMPDFENSMRLALGAFNRLNDAAVRHMIIISDGDPSPPGNTVLQNLKAAKVKVTTVGVGTHGPANQQVLMRIANLTGGKFYNVTNPNMLPRIYQKEARQISRPLVYEDKSGMTPHKHFPHEMIQGIEEALPPITGFVLTNLKPSPLVEVALLNPKPAGPENRTLLAGWTYGLGKAVAFTSDTGRRWAKAWTDWQNYDKLFSQIVRWSMRPVGDAGKFTISTDVQDGKVQVVVTALDKNDEFLNFLNMGGSIVGPDMKPIDIEMKQTAPGRYVGEFPAKDKGSYFVLLSPGVGEAPIRAGVNVPHSDEFRERETNDPLLDALAAMKPDHGKPGVVIEDHNRSTDPKQQIVDLMQQFNPFRHDLPKATSNQGIWPQLILAACLVFFADVFTRRVNVNFGWVPPLAVRLRDKVLRREPAPSENKVMDRLRSKKAEVGESLEQRRAAARFEPVPDAPPSEPLVEPTAMPVSPPKPKPAAGLTPDQTDADSYTSRLLKAKQKVWEDRKSTDQ
jgi:uncharacterized membrane protein/Mg-chelatase subunit ChlD